MNRYVNRLMAKYRDDGATDTALAIAERVYRRYKLARDTDDWPMRERDDLLEAATFTRPSYTDTLAYKGKSGLPKYGSRGYTPAERFVYVATNATVNKDGLARENGQILVDSVAHPPNRDRRVKLTNDVFTRRPIETINYAVSLIPVFNNYYHWLIENVLKLAMVEEYNRHLKSVPTILLPRNAPAWMYDTLDALNINYPVYQMNARNIHVNNLLVPSFPDPTRFELKWLRSHVQFQKPTDTVVVLRDDATTRQMANRKQVVEWADKRGFTTITPGEHSVEEQIQTFASAQTVIGVHGAGLTNIVFAPSTHLIEIFGDKEAGTYYRLCNLLNFGYTSVRMPESGGRVRVDITELESTLDN